MAKLIAEVTIRGKLSYAKILGSPVPTYDATKGKGSAREWKMDLELISPADVKELKSYGVGDRIKQKENYLDGAPYISLKQAELKKDGSPNRPPNVVEKDGKTPWDQTKLIGNDTVADVKIAIMDNGPGMKTSMYIRGVRVLKLVEYQSAAFAPLDEDDEYFAGEEDGSADSDPSAEKEKEAPKPSRRKSKLDDDLDDDIPF